MVQQAVGRSSTNTDLKGVQIQQNTGLMNIKVLKFARFERPNKCRVVIISG